MEVSWGSILNGADAAVWGEQCGVTAQGRVETARLHVITPWHSPTEKQVHQNRPPNANWGQSFVKTPPILTISK
jgi:hypothetical protein